MNPTQQIQCSFILTTDEQPPKKFPISCELANQCAMIKNMVGDVIQPTDKPHEPCPIEILVPNASEKDVLHFISYIKKVSAINKIPPTESEKSEESAKFVALNTMLSLYIKTLTTHELTNLFTIADYFNVIDKSKSHYYLTTEVSDRIIQKSAELASFYRLNGRPLFTEVIKKISNHINFEKIFIQPYSDSLTERQQLVRTIPIATSFYHNMRNIVTGPFRLIGLLPFIGPFPWAAKMIIKPQYLNNQTGTMITSFTRQLDTNKIVQLLITKKGTDQRIVIPLIDNDLSQITSIQSNREESVFICRVSNNKAIVINLLNVENPLIIDHNCVDCVFSDNENELYAIKDKEFGIVDIRKNNFMMLGELKRKTYVGIKANKNGTMVALCLDNEEDEEVWVWHKGTGNTFKDTVKKIFTASRIYTMCLHPTKSIVYVLCDDYSNFVCIDSVTQQKTALTVPNDVFLYSKKSIMQFLPEIDDILMISNKGKHANDYFFNTVTNHFWSKTKNKDNGRLWFMKKQSGNNYKRITLTADCRQSIERTIESNVIIDFIMCLVSKDGDVADFSVKKITAATLIDDPMIEAIKKINGGFLPLEVIQRAQTNVSGAADIKNITPEMQKVISASDTNGEWKMRWAKNIFYGLACFAVLLLKFKDKWGTIDIKISAHKLGLCILFVHLIERAIAQY